MNEWYSTFTRHIGVYLPHVRPRQKYSDVVRHNKSTDNELNNLSWEEWDVMYDGWMKYHEYLTKLEPSSEVFHTAFSYLFHPILESDQSPFLYFYQSGLDQCAWISLKRIMEMYYPLFHQMSASSWVPWMNRFFTCSCQFNHYPSMKWVYEHMKQLEVSQIHGQYWHYILRVAKKPIVTRLNYSQPLLVLSRDISHFAKTNPILQFIFPRITTTNTPNIRETLIDLYQRILHQKGMTVEQRKQWFFHLYQIQRRLSIYQFSYSEMVTIFDLSSSNEVHTTSNEIQSSLTQNGQMEILYHYILSLWKKNWISEEAWKQIITMTYHKLIEHAIYVCEPKYVRYYESIFPFYEVVSVTSEQVMQWIHSLIERNQHSPKYIWKKVKQTITFLIYHFQCNIQIVSSYLQQWMTHPNIRTTSLVHHILQSLDKEPSLNSTPIMSQTDEEIETENNTTVDTLSPFV